MSPTVSSSTPSSSPIMRLIEFEVSRLLQQHVDNGDAVFDVPLPAYASILAVAFYERQSVDAAGGTVVLSDSTLADLATFVRRNVELRRRRTSL